MIRKLRDAGDTNGYTATALLLAHWDPDSASPQVTARPDLVPADVGAGQFFTALIDQLLRATPVSHHVTVRERRERRALPLPEDAPGS